MAIVTRVKMSKFIILFDNATKIYHCLGKSHKMVLKSEQEHLGLRNTLDRSMICLSFSSAEGFQTF